jgi:hypothetical protein
MKTNNSDWIGRTVGRRFELERPLGQGSFGPRFTVKEPSASDPFSFGGGAVTEMQYIVLELAWGDSDGLSRHFDALKTVNHDHLLACRESAICETTCTVFFTTQLPDYSLRDALDQGSPIDCRSLLKHMTAGLAFLHAVGLVHGDLRADTVFFAGANWKLSPPKIRDAAAGPEADLAALADLLDGLASQPIFSAQINVLARLAEMCRQPDSSAAGLHALLCLGGDAFESLRKRITPVRGVRVNNSNGEAVIRWNATGETRLYRASALPMLACGKLMLSADLNAVWQSVKVVRNPSTGQYSASVRVDGEQAFNLIPVTISGTLAMLGEIIALGGIPAVALRSLSTLTVSGVEHLHIQWSWPDNVTWARVILRPDRAPTGPEDDAEKIDISRASYDINGGFMQPLTSLSKSGRRFHVAIFSLVRDAESGHRFSVACARSEWRSHTGVIPAAPTKINELFRARN